MSRPLFFFNCLIILILSITGVLYTPAVGLRENEKLVLSGKVKSMDIKSFSYGSVLSVSLKDVRGEGKQKITGPVRTITVWFPEDTDLKIGQTVSFEGKLSFYDCASNPGQFDYRKYNISKGNLFLIKDGKLLGKSREYSRIGTFLFDLRQAGEKIYESHLTDRDASVMKAMVFGNKNDLDEDTKELFQRNGIAHILAISGLHISFFGMSLFLLLKKTPLPTVLNVILAGGTIVVYALMVGLQPSVIRAGGMLIIYMISKLCKRTYDMATALSCLAVVLLAFNCNAIYDSGFRLSFMAVFGVVAYKEGFCRNIVRPPSFLNAFGISLSISLTTLPTIMSTYYQVPAYSVFLNLIVIPLMSLLLGAAVFMLIFAEFMLLIPAPFSIPAETVVSLLSKLIALILYGYRYICGFFEITGFGRVKVGAPKAWQTLIYYLLLLAFFFLPWKDIKDKFLPQGRWFGYGPAVAFAMLALFIISIRPAGGYRVYMLDVGQGDCMVIRSKGSNVYIIDCGSSSVKNVGSKRLIPFLNYMGVEDVEGVFVTHPDSDHMNGVEDLLKEGADNMIRVKRLILFDGFRESKEYDKLLYLADVAGTDIVWVHSGFELKDGKTDFSVLYPFAGYNPVDPNNASLVMKVNLGDFSMLTTGDVEAEGEEVIVSKYEKKIDLKVNLLKAAHHGSSSSSSRELLELVAADVAIISAGKDNPYGHPHKEVLDRLKEEGCDIYRTDLQGCLTVIPMAKKIRVMTYIQPPSKATICPVR